MERKKATSGGPGSAAPGMREWLTRAALATLSPIFFFLLLEGGLRLAGFGYPTSFFLNRVMDGKQVWTQNDQFGWRFFGPALARSPRKVVLPRDKPPHTYRIFVLGESAAYGDPQPDYGLSRILQVLLNSRYPGVEFEVVNASMTAINSHALRAIARDCAKAEGDLWVIYMGNNEVVGPFGSGTVFGMKTPRLGVVRASLTIKETRTGQLLEALISRKPAAGQEWAGMSAFLSNQVRHDAPGMTRVYSHFARNLQDMLNIAKLHGTRVVLCSVASNLRDCAPFGSQHQPSLPAPQQLNWERVFKAGIEAQGQNHHTEAAQLFEEAAKIDHHFAELQFRLGLSRLALGQEPDARERFRLARDYDTLRFRADTRLNELIRAAAKRCDPTTVRLVDAEQLFATHSPKGLPGSESFYEHVHFKFPGNYLLARSIAEAVHELLPDRVKSRATAPDTWLDESGCATRLAWTKWDQFQTLQSIAARLKDPPFTAQLTHPKELQRVQTELESLLPSLTPDGLRQSDELYGRALELSPNDWVLHQGRARLRRRMGDLPAAVQSLRRVAELLGPGADLHVQIGLLLNENAQPEEAVREFKAALGQEPRQVDALNGLGAAFVQLKRYPEAVACCEQALKLKPNSIDGHLNLAFALKALGREELAAEHFRRGLARKPLNAEALVQMGKACMQQGLTAEAKEHFSRAVQLDPSDANAHFCVGMASVAAGTRTEAGTHFGEAVRLNPNHAEARVGLGIELGRRGNDLAALEQFAAAVTLKPVFPEARLNLGVALLRQGKTEEAAHQFNEVLKLDPANPTARKLLESSRAR